MEEQERIVKGIWIPIDIWKDKNLSWNEKLLYLEIDSFTSKDKDCFISDEYIANFLGINTTNANKTLSSLIKKGYVVKTRFDGRHRFVKAALSTSTTLSCYEQQTSHAHDSTIIINNKDNITNTNNKQEKEDTIISSKKKAPKSDEPIVIAPEMQEVVDTWMQYKKEKGQSYKPTGFKTFYKNLCELSDNNPQVAMAIIEQSMRSNYAGIFPLRNNNNNGYGRETITDKIRRTVEEANEFSEQLRNRISSQADVCDGDNTEVW